MAGKPASFAKGCIMKRRSHHSLVVKSTVPVSLALLALLTVPGFARNSDQALLEQLYNEIITASSGTLAANDTTVSNKSTLSDKSDNLSTVPPLPADAATEHLQNEINRMMQDVKLRHDDAVRFMQETK